MHIFHNWGKWIKIREGKLEKQLIVDGITINPEKIEHGNYMDQERECLDCGKKEWNRQEVRLKDL